MINTVKTVMEMSKQLSKTGVIAAIVLVTMGTVEAAEWATSYGSYIQGLTKGGSALPTGRSDPNYALGPTDTYFFGLGYGGFMELGFDGPVGGELTVFEETWGNYPPETADVYGSKDGTTWTFLGTADNSNGLGSAKQHPSTFSLDTCYSYIRINDTTNPSLHGSSSDAFDVNSVSAEYLCQDCGEPVEIPLIAGQTMDAGTVTVYNDGEFLYVTYETTGDWHMTETHLHVACDPADIPQTKKGNPIPGQFDYSETHDPGVESYEVKIDLDDLQCSDVYIAAHAVVEQRDKECIDFEEFSEYDDVSTVSTEFGDVSFYMASSNPLVGLSIGDTGNLTPAQGMYPVVAEGDTGSGSPEYTGIVAFTVRDSGNPYRDDWVKDDGGTGAGGKLLTDSLDLSRTNLLQHAYSQYLAIVIDMSDIEELEGMSLAGIDLDWTETWKFQFFDENNVLIHEETVGPAADNSGDGVAIPISYSSPEVSKLAIWGSMNLGERERIGYAIDNVCVYSSEDETAWGEGHDFPGSSWGMYFDFGIKDC